MVKESSYKDWVENELKMLKIYLENKECLPEPEKEKHRR